LSLRSDNLDSVGELYTEDNFGQLVVTIEATPASLGGLGELARRAGGPLDVPRLRGQSILIQISSGRHLGRDPGDQPRQQS
jgi:hypothetical protein